MAVCPRMSFDSSSSSMPTPTEMRTSCENPENAEKPREWKKLVGLDEEESEEWRNIFQERFDRRTGGDSSKAPFFHFDDFRQTPSWFKVVLSRRVLPISHLLVVRGKDFGKVGTNWRRNKGKMLLLRLRERLQNYLTFFVLQEMLHWRYVQFDFTREVVQEI